MKRVKDYLRLVVALAVVIFIPLCQLGAAQSSPSPQESVPSIKETLDWLKEKINAYASFTEVISGRDSLQKVDLVNFDGCTMSYRYTNKAASIGLEIIRNFTFGLGDIDSSKVKIIESKGQKERYYLKLPALDNKPKIKVEMKAALVGTFKEEAKWTDEVQVPFDNFEMAYRVSTAFTHAINLCKGQKELFPSTTTMPRTTERSEEKQEHQAPSVKAEAVKMPVTILSMSLSDTAHPKFQSTDSGWCFVNLRNDDSARTIIQIEVYVTIEDSMRGITVDRLHLNLEGKVKPLKTGEMSASLGTYYLPHKWDAFYKVSRIRFEDGSEWKRP